MARWTALSALGLTGGPIPRRCLVATGVLIVAAIGLVPPCLAQTPLDYWRSLEAYREGKYDDAIAAASRLSREVVEEGSESLRDQRSMRAAIMLHTDVMFGSRPSGPLHYSTAESLVKRLLRLEPGSEFARDWYVLVASHLQAESALNASEEHLRRARNALPTDARILLASGCLHEMLTATTRIAAPNPITMQIVHERVNVRGELERAVKYFEQALAAEPSLAEARLRLGRSLHRLGRLNDAARELERVRQQPGGEPAFEYLAALFQASVEEDRGDRRKAATLYRSALEIYAGGQAALVGLSELFYADGQPAPAARLMQRLFDQPADADPWWAYLRGQGWQFATYHKNLRAKVGPS